MSQLKLCVGPVPSSIQSVPPAAELFDTKREPEEILDRKMVKRGRIADTKVLIKWKNSPKELATWEFYYDLLKKYHDFHP